MSITRHEIGYQGDGRAEDLLKWAVEEYHPRIALACSFQNTVLIHMLIQVRPDVRIFAIDTGRLPEETYECVAETERRFGIHVEWFFPLHDAVQNMLNKKGPLSFRDSLKARRECCAIRKVEPLTRALSGLDAWITGIRRDQSVTRKEIDKIQVDATHGNIVKICPLADWTDTQIRDYVRKHNLPQNRLFDQGYTSIGCACCTRPIQAGENLRAGRWWWEQSEHKECGLHVRDWNI